MAWPTLSQPTDWLPFGRPRRSQCARSGLGEELGLCTPASSRRLVGKDRMRLSWWVRIAIVLSLAWIVGGGGFEWSVHFTHAHSMALSEYKSCIAVKVLTHSLALGDCSQRSSAALAAGLKDLWGAVVLVAFAPVLSTWFAIYVIAKARQLAGRTNSRG